MITNAQKIKYKYLSLCPPDCAAAQATALFAFMHMQIACSVRVALCTCCALCAIKHMTQKHWCVRAAREREEGVKTHSYAVLKGCRERDIVRPPTPVQITPELPTVTVFYSRGRIPWKTVRWWPQHRGRISLPRWSGNAVIVTALIVRTTVCSYVCVICAWCIVRTTVCSYVCALQCSSALD